MPDKNKTPQPASGLLEEEAYQRIRQAIIDGSFSPADKLSIRGVCATLSLSPMPVRAALRRLINERALDATASGTALVPRLTRQEFQELTQMRLQLEPLALRLAAPHLTASDYTRLNALVASHEAARLAGDPAGVRQADTDFMLALYRASRSQLLLSFIESLWLRRSPFFWEARWALLSASTSRAPHRHSEIIHALQGGDIDAAQAFLTDEIQSACQFLLDFMSFKNDT